MGSRPAPSRTAATIAATAMTGLAVLTPPALAGGPPPPRCQASHLSVHLERPGIAAGSIGQVATFRNRSTVTCALRGSPRLQMLGRAGQRIPTHVKGSHATTVSFVPERLVVLRPGGAASFEAGWPDAAGFGRRKCPGASSVEVTPPGGRRAITVRWSLAPYGGSIPDVECGKIAVSPVYAGTGRYEPPRPSARPRR